RTGSRRWDRQRLTRRSVLRGTATGVVGLGLAGCATTSAPSPAPTAPQGAPIAPTSAVPAATQVPAAAAPEYGGTPTTLAAPPARNLDPHTGGPASTGAAGPLICYSQLVCYKWGPDVKLPSYTPTGDLAESWTQPDDLTYVFKLRPGVKFH